MYLLYIFTFCGTLFSLEARNFNLDSLTDSHNYIKIYTNENWNNEVNEVLNLLGVNGESRMKEFSSNSYVKRVHKPMDINGNLVVSHGNKSPFKWQYTVIATVCSVAAVIGVVLATTCYYKMSKTTIREGPIAGSRSSSSNNGSGIVALGGSSAGDKKLAQSAQMYHYQHQKQQMIALEKADTGYRNEGSDEESEPEDAVEDYTVYECPGMTVGDELEVKNPLFQNGPPSPPGSKNGN